MLEQATPRTPEQKRGKGAVSYSLYRIRQQLEKVTSEDQLPAIQQQADQVQAEIRQLLGAMPPPQGRFLIEDGYMRLTEGDLQDLDKEPAPAWRDPAISSPKFREQPEQSFDFTLDGDFTMMMGKSAITIPHGTRFHARSLSGFRVILTFGNGLEILIGKKDFPPHGIPIVEKPNQDRIQPPDDNTST